MESNYAFHFCTYEPFPRINSTVLEQTCHTHIVDVNLNDIDLVELYKCLPLCLIPDPVTLLHDRDVVQVHLWFPIVVLLCDFILHHLVALHLILICVFFVVPPLHSFYNTKSVVLCLGITAAVCLLVTIFSFQTKVRSFLFWPDFHAVP